MTQKTSQNKTYTAVSVPEEELSLNNNLAQEDSPKTTKSPSVRKKSDWARFISLAAPEKWRLLVAACFLLISSLVTMAIPYTLGMILDIIYVHSASEEETQNNLRIVCGAMLGVFLLGALCNFSRVYLMSTAGHRMTQSLRKLVFSSILQQEQAFFDQRPTGELVNRLSSDTQIVGQALSSNLGDGLRSTVMVLAGLTMMIVMSPRLAWVVLAMVPPVVIIAFCYGRFLKRVSVTVQDTLAVSMSVAEERISNVRTVKSFSQETKEIHSYGASVDRLLKICYKEAKLRAIFYAFAGFMGHMMIISVLYYGGVLVASAAITVGRLSSFLLYAGYIAISVSGLTSFHGELNKALGCAARLWEIVDKTPTIPISGGFTPPEPPEGHILFRDIEFSYPTRNINVFNGLTLEILPGKNVAVVGASGAGKSTLGALLLRLYDPQKGAVLIDGRDVRELDPIWLRRYIGTVSQEPILFSCSIRENILYGAGEGVQVSEEDLQRVAEEANVLEFVQELPQGFETLVGERGVMLSGGQKQRVAIARALIKNPKILLLDEATSALDAQSEFLVQEALDKVMQGRTVLTIAHRFSTIQNADSIAVIKDGKTAEQGKYQELLELEDGVFKELMKHQRDSILQ